MVALGILVVLIAIVVTFCYKYVVAHYQRWRLSKKPVDPENPILPSDIQIPHWSSTADLVTERFARLEMMQCDPYYDPTRPPQRGHQGGIVPQPVCDYCGRGHDSSHHGDDYELTHGRRTNPVFRAHDDCGSDLELPKYTSHPTASNPRLIADDEFPPPPTPPPEAHVHDSPHAEGLDLTAAVARVIVADRAAEQARREERERERERRDSQQSAISVESSDSVAEPITPPPRARRWTFASIHKNKNDERRPSRPPVNLGTTALMVSF